MNTTRSFANAALISAILLTGCMVGPNYHAPDAHVKSDWNKEAPASTQPATRPYFDTKNAIENAWWKSFNDHHIDSLVQRALKSSPDLAIAANRVLESRAQRAIVVGGLYPSVNAGGTYDYYHRAGPLAATIPGDYQWYQVGFDSSWEIDLFGGIRRSIESATAASQASIESENAVRLSLIADVVRNYIDLRAAQKRLDIATENLRYQEKTLSITKERHTAGVVGGIDVTRAEALVAGTRSLIPPLKDDAQRAIRSLGILLGQDPDALTAELTTNTLIPSPPAQLAIGLPADLLQRRPDIRQAERQLAAANARIGVATADLYPHFALLGGIGQLDIQTQQFFDWSRRYASIGPEASWNLFNGGRTRGQINAEKAATAAALAQYQKTVLAALAETENEMTALDSERERHTSLLEAANANKKTVNIASQLYLQGVTDFITVLDAERSLASSEDAVALSDQAINTHVISLCKSLGGGWAHP